MNVELCVCVCVCVMQGHCEVVPLNTSRAVLPRGDTRDASVVYTTPNGSRETLVLGHRRGSPSVV